jgi:hypothetical protein
MAAIVLALVAIWASSELFTILTWSVANGRLFTLSTFQQARSEAVTRSAAPETQSLENDDRPPRKRFLREEILHPYQGYVLNPHSDRTAYPYPFVSDYGFPDDKPPVQPFKEGSLVVALTGGSFAAQLGLSAGEELTKRLQMVPAYRGKEIVLVRLGVPGYKQPQQLLTVMYLLSLGAHFDVLANIDGFNEIALPVTENIPTGTNPFFPRYWFWRVQAVLDPGWLALIGRLGSVDDRRAVYAGLFETFPLNISPILNVVWSAIDRSLSQKEFELKKELLAYRPDARDTDSVMRKGPPFPLSDEHEQMGALAAMWYRASAQLDKVCRANGTRYYHFLQPNQYVENTKPMSETEKRIAIKKDHPYSHWVPIGYPWLIQYGAELRSDGVRFTDLTGVLKGHSEDLYKDSCCHLNDKGYAVVAEAMAEAIREDLE